MPRDVTKAGLCMAGAREWAKLNGIDYSQFLAEGIPVSEMRAVNCPLGNRACDKAEERARSAG